MPYCLQPRCDALVVRGYCPRHARRREQDRGTAARRGYDYRWQVRSLRFRQLYPLCGMRPGNQRPVCSLCFETGRATLANLVDHVVPHRRDPVLFWDELGNWQSLCDACHRRKTRAGF
jgi:5-methylcytosine-specific restriction protein A